jgi:diguanylate cyclase (GGDEF)-like protein/PAS domain S-box-containing protein
MIEVDFRELRGSPMGSQNHEDQNDLQSAGPFPHHTPRMTSFIESILRTIDEAIIVTSTDGEILYWNRAAEELYGWAAPDVHRKSLYETIALNKHSWEESPFSKSLRSGQGWTGELLTRRRDNNVFLANIAVRPAIDDVGKLIVILFVSRKTEHLEGSSPGELGAYEPFRIVFEGTIVPVAVTDASGEMIWVNDSLCSYLGYRQDELMGTNIVTLIHSDEPFVCPLGDVGEQTGWRSYTTIARRYVHRSGEERWATEITTPIKDRAHGEQQFLWELQDFTSQKRLEQELERQWFLDVLTNLPNRMLLNDRIEHELARSLRTSETIAVIFIDLDNFKVINDSLGHAAGDDVLITVANRLRNCVRETDTVSRFGGDEFVVLLTGLEDTFDAIDVVERIQDALREPLIVVGHQMTITSSIGVAMPHSDEDAEVMLRYADTAMYRAKTSGRDRYALFDISMHREVLTRLTQESDLRQAIERNEFHLHFQPIVNITTGQIWGFEALIRWAHPVQGEISPGEFIPLAEETGLIVPISEWVLREALSQMVKWKTETNHPLPLRVTVNISARQFKQIDLLTQINSAINETGVTRGDLVLELTESTISEDASRGSRQLASVRGAGIDIAIDDFGTGYSSLVYLKHFAFDLLKIDRGFTDGLGIDDEDSAIVEAIIVMAHALGIETVAEGVETERQLFELQRLNCDYAQGFYFWPALPPEVAMSLLGDEDANNLVQAQMP